MIFDTENVTETKNKQYYMWELSNGFANWHSQKQNLKII